MKVVYSLVGVVLLLNMFGTDARAATRDEHFHAVAIMVVAARLTRQCDGIRVHEKYAAGDFAPLAADQFASEGYRKQRILKFYFYGKTTDLDALEANYYIQRGVDASQAARCRFARSIAGSADELGRFLAR